MQSDFAKFWLHFATVALVYLATAAGMFVSQYQVLAQSREGFHYKGPWLVLLAIGAFVLVLRDESNRKGMSREDFRNGKMKNLDRRLIQAFFLGYGASGLSGILG